MRVILQDSAREFAEEPVLVKSLMPGASVQQADLNDDGFDDLVVHENGRVRCLLSSPDGFAFLSEFEIGANRLDLEAVADSKAFGFFGIPVSPSSLSRGSADFGWNQLIRPRKF